MAVAGLPDPPIAAVPEKVLHLTIFRSGATLYLVDFAPPRRTAAALPLWPDAPQISDRAEIVWGYRGTCR